MLVVRPPLIVLGLCSVRAAEHGSCRNIILLRTRRQTNKTSHLLLLLSQTVVSLYRRRMPIYYTMITSLTRNASILSGGRAWPPAAAAQAWEPAQGNLAGAPSADSGSPLATGTHDDRSRYGFSDFSRL